jgi:hypothetical protein
MDIATKIELIESELSKRYPQYTLIRLSVPYDNSTDADDDTEYSSYIYTNADLSKNPFGVGNLSYTDRELKTLFDGLGDWYHVFTEDAIDLRYSVQIGGNGLVSNKSNKETPIFILSKGTDNIRACLENNFTTQVYFQGETIVIGTVLYVDSQRTTRVSGGNLWYRVFQSSSNIYYIIQIDSNGTTIGIKNCKPTS